MISFGLIVLIEGLSTVLAGSVIKLHGLRVLEVVFALLVFCRNKKQLGPIFSVHKIGLFFHVNVELHVSLQIKKNNY
jgi:DNA-directed RNA polymerase subunit E'/Rpb7